MEKITYSSGDIIKAHESIFKVRWASPPAIHKKEKLRMAKELRNRMRQEGYTKKEAGKQSRHEFEHGNALAREVQFLLVGKIDSRRVSPATIFLEELTNDERLVVALAPRDPQMDDLIEAKRIEMLKR